MMKARTWLAASIAIGGTLVAAGGIALVLMYLWAAVVERWGEPDQSLIFWYLPLLFIGMALGVTGGALFRFGMRRFRELNRERSARRQKSPR
jgi:hypothetical protein